MKKILILLIATLLSFNGFTQSISPGFGSGKVAETHSRVLTDGGDIYPNCASSQIDEQKRADIWDKVVLDIRAGVGAKAGTLYNTSDSAIGDLTSTRSSVRSTTDTDGNVSHIAINYPAIDFSTGCPFISAESGATNLFLNSDVGVTQTVTVVSGQDYAFYFRSGSGSIALTGAATQTISVSDGTFDNAYLFTAASTSLVCTVTGTANEVQAELNDHASSYIVTDGSTATRAADAYTNSGDATLFADVNSSGVLFAEIAYASDNGIINAISLHNTGGSNYVTIRTSATLGRIECLIWNGTAAVGLIRANGLTLTDSRKIAYRWKQDEFTMYIDGVEVTPAVTTGTPISTIEKLSLERGNGANQFYGKCKQLGVYEYLTDAEMAALTEMGMSLVSIFPLLLLAISFAIRRKNVFEFNDEDISQL